MPTAQLIMMLFRCIKIFVFLGEMEDGIYVDD